MLSTLSVRCLLVGSTVFTFLSPSNSPGSEVSPRPEWRTSAVTGAPVAPEPYRIQVAFPKVRFENPTSLCQIPGVDRILVTQINGKMFSISKQNDSDQKDLVADLGKLAGGAVSLFHATLHPEFLKNRFLYACYVHPGKGGHTRVSRFTLRADGPAKILEGSEQVVITWPSGGHNAGCLYFGNDGFLYISTGDGSGPNPPDGLTTGQTVTDLLGAILRIDVNRTSGEKSYAVPSDNPFVSLEGARPEIWAYGLRNPWKFGIDPKTNNVFVADNGWETWELIHRIERGGNCGWPVMEGRASLRTEVKVGPTPIIPPVKDHPHTEANSVIGGPVYRGQKVKELDGTFIYGDYITGTIWGLRAEQDGSYTHSTLVDTDQRITGFAVGSKGEIYVLDYDFTGQIYELTPNPAKDTSADFPTKLSETGLFSSLDELTPAQGVVPYEVKVPRWMDGAEAKRWIAIPGRAKVELNADSHLSSQFPDGTVLVKSLSIDTGNGTQRRLETQLLHFEDGRWNPYSYLWDAAGKDANLVPASGTDQPITAKLTGPHGVQARTWHVSAQNECRLCHNAGSHFVLGFSANQLDRIVHAGGFEDNQLSSLQEQAVIRQIPDIPSSLNLVDPHDVSASIDDRARSYLHANCSMCHHLGGNAIVSFYLSRNLSLDQLNTNKGTGIGTFGMQNAKVIALGDPYRSVLFYRFLKLGYGRMPYIGSQVVDSQGVAILDEWIRSLPGSSAKSAPLTKDSLDARAIQTVTRDGAGDVETENAIQQLLKSTEGALALVSKLHQGKIQDAHASTLIASGEAKSDINGLLETFIPESLRRARLGPTFDPQIVLSKNGDIPRGKLIYSSDAARCRNCHDSRDEHKSFGPTIVAINKKYPRESELLGHILNPSQKIDDQYASYTVITTDGKVVSGFLIKNTDSQIVVKTIEKKTITLSREDVEDVVKNQRSLMPERLVSDLTAQEAADLLEYFRSIK